MNPYFEQMILSASPVELIRLLYQRAISSVRDAREHLRNRRIAERCASINVAYSVLLELAGSLREDDAPDLAVRLKDLYCYMQGRLVDANLNQVDEPLSEVLGLLVTLSEAWSAIPDSFASSNTESAWNSVSPAGMGVDEGMRVAVSA